MNSEVSPDITTRRKRRLKSGLLICWLSLGILPAGVFLGAVGMCAGPTSTGGALGMVALALFGVLAILYGGLNVLRGFRFGNWPLRLFALLSLLSTLLVGFVSWLYWVEAKDYLDYVLRSR